jgi:AcrR family transcriptional regulator
MPRTVNVISHTVRREAFLDAAQELIQTRGYERMSVQDVLDKLQTSRGAFYHYFDSKLALLEGVVDRFSDGAIRSIQPILTDPTIPAPAKLERIIAGFARLKAERKELMLALIEVMNSDANALFREKLRRLTVDRLSPILAEVIQQGIDERVFGPVGPQEAVRIVLALIIGFQDVASELFIARQQGRTSFEVVRRSMTAFTEAFERILGAATGSIRLVDDATLHFWFD